MTTRAAPASTTRRAAVSTASQLAAKVVHLVLNVVSTLAVVRYLAPEGYGTYVLVATVTTLAGVVADFGLPKLAVREAVRVDADPGAIIGTVAALRLVLALVAALAVQVTLLAFGQSSEALLAGAVACLVTVGDAVLGVVVVAFQIHLLQQYEAIIRVLGEAVETALVLVLVWLGAALPMLFVPPVVGVAVGTVLALRVGSRRFALRLRLDRSLVRGLVTEALPLGPGMLVGVLCLKLDSLVVAALLPAADLGRYGAAYQPIEYLLLASAIVINVLFTVLARAWAVGDRVAFRRIYARGTEVLLAVTLAVPVVLVGGAPWVVELAFGPSYAASAQPLRWLSVALVLMTINAWQSVVLLATGFQRITLAYNLAALAVSVPVDVVLIRSTGIDGAALAALAGAVLVLCCSTVAVRRCSAATLPAGRVLRLVAAAAVSAAAVAWLVDRQVTAPAAMLAGLAGLAVGVWRLRLLPRLQEALG